MLAEKLINSERIAKLRTKNQERPMEDLGEFSSDSVDPLGPVLGQDLPDGGGVLKDMWACAIRKISLSL